MNDSQFKELKNLSTETNTLLHQALEAANRIEQRIKNPSGSNEDSNKIGALDERFSAMMDASLFLMNRLDETNSVPHLKATATGIKTMLVRAAVSSTKNNDDEEALNRQKRFGFAVDDYKCDETASVNARLDYYYPDEKDTYIKKSIGYIYGTSSAGVYKSGSRYKSSDVYNLMSNQIVGVREELIFELCMIHAYSRQNISAKDRNELVLELIAERDNYRSGVMDTEADFLAKSEEGKQVSADLEEIFREKLIAAQAAQTSRFSHFEQTTYVGHESQDSYDNRLNQDAHSNQDAQSSYETRLADEANQTQVFRNPTQMSETPYNNDGYREEKYSSSVQPEQARTDSNRNVHNPTQTRAASSQQMYNTEESNSEHINPSVQLRTHVYTQQDNPQMSIHYQQTPQFQSRYR